MSLFQSFYDHPKKIRFCEQEADEHIELLLRQHWVTNLPWMFTATLGLVAPVILGKYLEPLILSQVLPAPPEIIFALNILWYLLILGYIFEKYLQWFFNIYIISNTHLVDINFYNLMNRDVTESRLDDVQSVSSTVKGIIAPLFNFGDVVVETAAERQKIAFESVPRPDAVADRIQDLQERQEKGGSDVG
jgi:uncharacterized membrane protein YdbT with pleckstrin-like domain